MNSEEAVKIIETICDKLGIAVNSAKDIVPELAKYEISKGVFWSLSSIVIILICFYLIKKTISLAKKEIEKVDNRWDRDTLSEYPSVWVMGIVCGFFIVCYVIKLFNSLAIITTWIISPEASAIKYVLSLIQ